MGLDNLSPPEGARTDAKRVGRGHGSGSGKTSGRGHKGQKARSGASIPAWFEGGQMPLHRRTPKRGFRPYRRTDWAIVNVSELGRVEGSEIDPETLSASGVIKNVKKPVKILARGEVERALTVRAHAFSAAAREKIEAAGGTAQVIE
ncbi:MAG: 50S ribosomal protein L15 [Gemmatimonadota bacterium]|nr:50S ribosomal protein L15 [Gemmatimonadota bacterium]